MLLSYGPRGNRSPCYVSAVAHLNNLSSPFPLPLRSDFPPHNCAVQRKLATMTPGRETDEDEQTSLLSPPESNSTRDGTSSDVGNRSAFFLALALIALLQAGLIAPVVSSTGLMENVICQREHGSLRDCKAEDVQSKLAMLKGIASLTSLIPGTVGGDRWCAGRWLSLPQAFSSPSLLVPSPTASERVPSWR